MLQCWAGYAEGLLSEKLSDGWRVVETAAVLGRILVDLQAGLGTGTAAETGYGA